MKEIKFYRTYSYGGVEGRDKVVRNFETIRLAVENAVSDTWNDNFKLYEVKMIFNGVITESEKFLENLTCGRDLQKNETTNNVKKR